jgi:hypothetical protein
MRVGFVWISLDSLVRIYTFQWVTPEKAQKFFSGAFLSGISRAAGEACGFCREKCRIAHKASLSWFLIFCKKLPFAPFFSGRLNPKDKDCSLHAFSSRLCRNTARSTVFAMSVAQKAAPSSRRMPCNTC